MMKRLSLAAALSLGLACQRSNGDSLGTMQFGGPKVDPRFDQAWRALAARADDEAEVFYIEDDRGEGLMGRVRRGSKAIPRPPAPPALAPPPTAQEPEQPDGQAVSATVRSNVPGIKACYLRLTRQGKIISGRAILSFTVDRDGSAKDVRVEAPAFADSELPRCMSVQAGSWTFPRSRRGGLAVSYPFVFVGG
jgi:hypothetical protein